MILWRFKERLEPNEKAPCKSFRWVLEAQWFYLGLVYQYQLRSNDQWVSSHTIQYSVCLNRYWSFGGEHIYYDGPHCSFSIGPVHFNWWNGSCEKCFERFMQKGP